MTRITNSDQIAHLLRAKLTKMDGAKRKASPSRAASPQKTRQRPTDRVRSLAQDDLLDDEQSGEALVRALLVEEYGAELADDPRFGQVLSKVLAQIRQDEGAAELLGQAVETLKS